MPTIIVAVFSYLFFSFGVESWFSDKVRTAISESVAVADAYVNEHQQAIRADALAMASDLNRYAASLQLNPQYLAPGADRAGGDARPDRGGGVRRAMGTMLARTGLVFALGFEDVSKEALQRARKHGDVAIMTNDQRRPGARARAARRVQRRLSLCRPLRRSQGARASRRRRSARRRNTSSSKASAPGYQITFSVIFILVACCCYRRGVRSASTSPRSLPIRSAGWSARPSGCAAAIFRPASRRATRTTSSSRCPAPSTA